MPDPENPAPAIDPALQQPTPVVSAPSASLPEAPPATATPPADDFDDYEELTPEIAEEEAVRNDFVLRWAVVLLAFLLASTHIAETATLVHIKTGQYLAEHGFLPPRTDIFSYTAPERPWANLSWGFDLLVAGIHALGSFTALSAVKAVVVALAFWVIGRISRPGTPTWWGSVCGALALLGCHLRMPAQPQIVTYLGLALTMWVVYSWREAPEKPKRLWLLLPLFVLWSNCDSRAWLGLAYVLLYALGDCLGAWLKSPAALGSAARKQLWQVLGASLAITLVHPFWWKSLASPWLLYGVEYPALRDYILETVLDPARTNTGGNFTFFPMTNEELWTWQFLNLGILASLAVVALAVVAVALNRARLDWGLLTALLGFALFAAACLHELPAAGLVAAVVATLNGQGWYVASCRQVYSIETGELLFSRGGRALTVLVLAALGFFGGTGRLRDASAARPGYGIDNALSVQVDDLERLLANDASFDHRPFNSLLAQGDQLIWIGEKVFCDNRVGVYYSPVEEDNILRQHIVARDALRGRRRVDAPGQGAAPRNGSWRKTFDQYGISHVVVRLAMERDYELFFELLQQQNWEWTGLGASAVVFYRTTVPDADPQQYKAYVESHKIDFHKMAYDEGQAGRDADQISSGRLRPIRAPSFYKKYFWSTKVEPSADVREAFQLATLAGVPLPRKLESSRTAMAYLAIRRAQVGLSKDPDDVNGYIALGQAYDFLSQIEYQASLGVRPVWNGLRYLQAVAAYNQALVGEPDNLTAHQRLLQLYREGRKPDLAFRHLSALDDDMLARPDRYSDDQAKMVGQQISELNKVLKQVDEAVAQAGSVSADSKTIMSRMQAFLQRDCYLRALMELDRDPKLASGDTRLELVRMRLMLETGRVDEAFDIASRFAAMAEMQGVSTWADNVSPCCLAQGDYDNAIKYWEAASNEIERLALGRLVLTLPPRTTDPNAPWPLSTLNSTVNYYFQSPEQCASMKINAALSLLEEGRIKSAELAFREVLEISPDSSLRALVKFYISELTFGKEEIDIVPPSNRIIELFTPEPE